MKYNKKTKGKIQRRKDENLSTKGNVSMSVDNMKIKAEILK
jgi:hypothetical protein